MAFKDVLGSLISFIKNEPVPKEMKVRAHRCPQNHKCPAIRSCPNGALRQKGFKAPVVNKMKCTDCGICTRYCAFGALKMVKIEA